MLYFANTHLDPLIEIPSKKSRNLFVHPENKCLQAPCPVFFLSAHCQKLYLVLRSKNATIYAYTDNSEKAQFSGPWTLCSFPYAVDQKKNTVSTQHILVNNKLFKTTQNRTLNSLFSIRKKTPLFLLY